MPCIAVKADGHPCNKAVREGEFRCGRHIAARNKRGPNATEVAEFSYTFKKDLKDLQDQYDEDIVIIREEFRDNVNEQQAQLNLCHQNYVLRRRDIKRNRKRVLNQIQNEQADAIRRNGGVDPDAEANARRRTAQFQREENRRARRRQLAARLEDQIRGGGPGEAVRLGADRERRRQAVLAAGANPPAGGDVEWPRLRNILARGDNLMNQVAAHLLRQPHGAALGPVPPLIPARQAGELEQFAQDRQKVHTTHAVNQTKEIVARILKIPVPPEYRWNMDECSKTPGEIILECKVSPTATWQMMAKYCQADNVYEMGKGIYGRVLDCVWQYIKGSEHKEDLCKILKTEMQDNIGMCAQGNLSRLANIVAGYMEGVGAQESLAEILGRLLPPLMEIVDEGERLDKAKKIMDDYHVPVDDRPQWLEALA